MWKGRLCFRLVAAEGIYDKSCVRAMRTAMGASSPDVRSDEKLPHRRPLPKPLSRRSLMPTTRDANAPCACPILLGNKPGACLV